MSPEDERELRTLILLDYSISVHRAAECDGKQKFLSHNQAAGARHGEKIRRLSEPYRCTQCGYWHVGTRPHRK